MTDKQTLSAQSDHGKAWRFFLSNATQEDTRAGEESSATDLVDSLIAVLSPAAVRHPLPGDLEIVHRTMSSVQEAAAEGVITEDEAYDVVRFVVTKFVERRFNGILLNVFDLESSRRCTFHEVAGRLKHGREERTIR